MAGQSRPQMTASSLSAQAPQMFDGPVTPVVTAALPHRPQRRVRVTGLMSYMTVTSFLSGIWPGRGC